MEWIDISKREPKDGEMVLFYVLRKRLDDMRVYEMHTGRRQGKMYIIGNFFSWDMGEPLFWAELPAPPSESASG